MPVANEHSPMIDNTAMVVSFLIPALNEETNIGQCIKSIERHAPPNMPKEIIVGNHGSTDTTAAIADGLGAKIITVNHGTISNLRNKLVETSHGLILIFLDADIRLTDSWTKNISSVIDQLASQPDQITGSVCSIPDQENLLQKCWFASAKKGQANHIGTGHLIIPRSIYDTVSGFRSDLTSGEDFDFCQRVKQQGYEVVLRNELKVVHLDFPTNIQQFARREVWHGTGDFYNLGTFLKSKVAILGLTYSLILFSSVLVLFASPAISIALILASLPIPTALSFYKFEDLPFSQRCVNISLCAVYLLSRGVSFFYRKSSKRPYSKVEAT
jgi:glycosyltransferase involved in cell wall biosynthesis